MRFRRDALVIGVLGLLIGAFAAFQFNNPGYTDGYYYFNAGRRLIEGKGLTDAAIFTYIGAPAGLPVPSHVYWMPLTSFVAAGGMLVGGPTFDAAQLCFVGLFAGTAMLTFQIGAILGKTRRTAWIGGLLVLFSGFYMPWFVNTTTIAPFALVGSLSLLAMGLGRRAGNVRWYALAGVCAALAHLTRADGLLLFGMLIVVALWPGNNESSSSTMRRKVIGAAVGVATYAVVMLPWVVRNLGVIGSPLPIGGLDTAWMRSYDEITRYPPGASFSDFSAWGLSNIVQSRWAAFLVNVQRFVAEQGLVVVTPLMLLGLWHRRRDPLLSGFILYAPALHLLMTLVFAFPGPRGGLFHSASALLPFWAALGALGLDDVIDWIAPRRRWRPGEAKLFFSGALVVIAASLSLSSLAGKAAQWNAENGRFDVLTREAGLSPNDLVMINDPPALYYFTHIGGVVLPDAPPDALRDIAARYGVRYVIVDANRPALLEDLWIGRNIPAFLELTYSGNGYRVYRIKTG
jgi:4-amino-4-deoxy-L-arabinose transferase-like glycosyltransferase